MTRDADVTALPGQYIRGGTHMYEYHRNDHLLIIIHRSNNSESICLMKKYNMLSLMKLIRF